MSQLDALLGQLEVDQWRSGHPFSDDIQQCHDALRNATCDDSASQILQDWIANNQPCFFGRMAARTDSIRFCILRDDDLIQDLRVRDKIQAARSNWLSAAFEGTSSAFVVTVLSDRLAAAKPSRPLLQFACRLASLYLLRDVAPDHVEHERIYLEVRTDRSHGWEWYAGVNWFSAQGDGRWWHDHRFPGGAALSVNSVGHMVQSGRLAKTFDALHADMGLPDNQQTANRKVASLGRALELAMRTIGNASKTANGPATKLLSRTTSGPVCPYQVPSDLSKFDCATYGGRYHTDWTIPSDYFVDDPGGPDREFELDFTYLYARGIDNPDFETMGAGRQIRTPAIIESERPGSTAASVSRRMLPRLVRVADCPELAAAMRSRGNS